jgi:hypothetical protein
LLWRFGELACLFVQRKYTVIFTRRKLRPKAQSQPNTKLFCRVLSNFSVTFSIVSVMTGVTTLFGTGR